MFENKVIVITGGAGVIGKEIAKSFLKAKATVAILGINNDENQEAMIELLEYSKKIKAYQANVLDVDSLIKIRKQIETDIGPCDVLINAAGGNNPKATTDDEFYSGIDKVQQDFFHLNMEAFGRTLDLNLLGTVLPTQVFAEKMAERKSGNIINISSMNAYTPLTKIPAYSASKAAINNLTQWLAVYFSKVNVRVNAVAPGFLITKQNEQLLKSEDGSFTARAEKILSQTPMERFGKPEEMTGAIQFLANDHAASFITGVIIPIDGGFSSYSGV